MNDYLLQPGCFASRVESTFRPSALIDRALHPACAPSAYACLSYVPHTTVPAYSCVTTFAELMTPNDRNSLPAELRARGSCSDHDAFQFQNASIIRAPVPSLLPLMRQQAMFSDHIPLQNRYISRNTVVITNSGYGIDQQRLGGITFPNEICVGLPANVSWNELLCERPSNVLYLNQLLDCTRALNREYKTRRRAPRSVVSSNRTKVVPVLNRRSREACTSKASTPSEESEVRIMRPLLSDQELVRDGNDLRDSSAVERAETTEEKPSSSSTPQYADEPSNLTAPLNSATNTNQPTLENVTNDSGLVTGDAIEDENGCTEVMKSLKPLCSKLNMKIGVPVVHPTDGSSNEARNASEEQPSEHTEIPLPATESKKKKKKGKRSRENNKEGQKSEKPGKTDKDQVQFDHHYDDDRVQNGIADGTMFQALLRINSRNVKEAYVNCTFDDKDVFIDGVKDRNGALEGDEVVVELYPQDRWKLCPDKTYQKCGKVVAISQKNHPRIAVGHLKVMYGKTCGIILCPRDYRLPKIRLDEKTCPPNFRAQHQQYRNTLFSGLIVSWDAVELATGIVLRNLGDEHSTDVESVCILLENNLRMEPLENEAQLTAHCSAIPESEFKVREDIRERCVFTIDPPTAKDLDDALSLRCLPNGNIEVGVHIADVTYYLLNDTPLDQDVRKKATSVYLVDKVYHMLPSRLCRTCSLLPGEDKLAFSLFVELNESADVIAHRFSKTVLRSCAQLNYGHAQDIIDRGNPSWKEGLDFPPIGNGHTVEECVQVIWQLHSLAAKMRRRRFSEGALRIDQPKLVFHLDESGSPTSCTLYEGRESNWLVEEFMLLANILAANKMKDAFPSTSLLRHHAAPKEKSLSTIKKYLEKVGIHIDTSSAGHIYKSMRSYDCHDEIGVARMTVIMHLLVKPMMRARYTCSASCVDDDSESWHYALNTPFYTHFTSPIRRYADVVVHRLLASAVGYAEAPNWTSDDIRKIATNCNIKTDAAKRASEQSTEWFLRLYIEMNGAQRERAVVTEVKEKFFDIISLSTRSVGRIYVDVSTAAPIEFPPFLLDNVPTV